jgi:hypothetical protein
MLLQYLQCLTVFLLLDCVQLATLHDERRQIIEHVRNYLQKSDIALRQGLKTRSQLENSNKIDFVYNLLTDSPVCYTDECQMAGFTRSIFQLNYTSPVPESCTDKLVPDNVDIDCLPLTLTVISNKVEISIGTKYNGIGFSYRYSKDSQYMLDTIA